MEPQQGGGRPRLFALNGLLIDSDIELRTAVSLAAGEPRPHSTLRISLAGEAPATPPPGLLHLYDFPEVEPDRQPILTVWRQGDGFWIRVHGFADFEVADAGGYIGCLPVRDGAAGSVEQILIDQIIPRVMHLRGEVCLHASAVELSGGGVVALMGASGTGKSTLCAALCRTGARMLCDDCLRVTIAGPSVQACPGYGSLRLWPDSAVALVESAGGLPAASPHTEKLRVAQRLADGPCALRQVLLLDPTADSPRLERVGAQEAVAQLAAVTRRLDPEHAEAMRTEFETLGALAERVPTSWLRFAHDWQQLDSLLDTIERCAAAA